MSCIYQSQGFSIYPQRQLIMRDQESIQVRPKTFALLMLLLEKPGEVLSKSYLLDSIWDDVKVEEQVLVQSIRELRQLFGSAGIIQTYPRKGYAWAAEVVKAEPSCPDAARSTSPNPANPAATHRPWWRKSYALPALLLALGITTCGLFYTLRANSSAVQTEVVLVLPVKNQLPGNDYNWVPLGVMDQVIHLLVSDQNTQVMPPEYVFQVMQFARLDRRYDSAQVPRLFEVSGATLVVESQLTGFIDNYRLDYKLRSRQDINRGVLFDKDLNQLSRKLGEVIVNQTGQQLQDAENNAQTAFHNELMARGVEKFDQQDYAAAQTLFRSLLQLDQGNLYARDHLIRALVWGEKLAEAHTEIEAALVLANNTDGKAVARLHFYQSLVQRKQGQLEAALHSLALVEREAVASGELLMQSSAAETRAQILQERGNLSAAQASYEQALKLNSIIRCAIGMSGIHLKLADLLLLQGQQEQAQKHYQQAKELIETHQLEDMKPALTAAKF